MYLVASVLRNSSFETREHGTSFMENRLSAYCHSKCSSDPSVSGYSGVVEITTRGMKHVIAKRVCV